jgi:hypothetical protein
MTLHEAYLKAKRQFEKAFFGRTEKHEAVLLGCSDF